MNLHLTPEIVTLIEERIASGRYDSAEQVIGDALRLLDAFDREAGANLDELRAEIAVGMADLDEGRAIEFDDESLGAFMRDVVARGRVRLARRDR